MIAYKLSIFIKYEIFAVFKTVVYSKNTFKYYNFVNFSNEDEFNTFVNKFLFIAYSVPLLLVSSWYVSFVLSFACTNLSFIFSVPTTALLIVFTVPFLLCLKAIKTADRTIKTTKKAAKTTAKATKRAIQMAKATAKASHIY